MPNFDFINLVVLILAAGSAWLFFYLQKKHSIAENLPEATIDTLNATLKEAKNIESEAQLNALKIATDTRFYREKLEEKMQEQISNYIKDVKTSLDKSTQEFENYLKFLKTESDAEKNSSSEMIKSGIAQTFVKFEENLTKYLGDAQARSLQSVELELNAARNLIETYKSQQLKIVDENIIAMLEKTLSLVLSKKLTLQDQMDLVYEALEKAKGEKFII